MILKYPIHDAFHKYMVKLNDIYKKEKAFHYDYHRENFEWLDCIRKNDVFMRSEEKRQITRSLESLISLTKTERL